jgi:peptidoglycan/LPS O-acetylase OafA/YrhL
VNKTDTDLIRQVESKQHPDHPDEQKTYMWQLDGLRCFAVLGVLVSHFWIPQGLPWLLADMDWGWIGVRLFFVLSGFLITGILLDARQIAGNKTTTSAYQLRQFYARRFLRIFPIYYLVIMITIALNIPLARELWAWLVTYTSNIYITLHNTWIGYFSHFWSLAVEEQFYLIWPFLILILPKKWLLPSVALAILVAPVYRFSAYQLYRGDISPFDFKAGTLTPANLDSLGMGAMLAIFWHNRAYRERVQKYTLFIILPVGILLYLVTLALYHYDIKPSVFFTLNDFALALIFAWLVSSAAMGFKGTVGKFISFPIFVYLGKISYGIYVYHYFMPLILVPVMKWLGFEAPPPGPLNFILAGSLSIAIASLSWYLFEYPINRLKRHFAYVPVPNAEHPYASVSQ